MKKLAYKSSLVLFYVITAVLAFIFIFSILSFLEYKFGINIPFVEILDNRAKVNVTIFGLGINIPFNYAILLMWLSMLYYATYFYAFKEFLKVFVEKQAFKGKSIKRLKRFLILNLIPSIYIVLFTLSFLFKGKPIRFDDDYFIVFAHLVIAFLVYLYLDILKKGNHIKEENDLTI